MNLRKVRGRPFQLGNPGRPPGSKNRVTQLVQQLAEGHAEDLIAKVRELALAGDVSCLRIMLDRLWPARKGVPVDIAMPPINSRQDVFAAIASVWSAIREGRLTADEAAALSIVIDRSIRAIELYDIENRIAALEAARDQRDAKNEFKPPA